MWSMRDSHRDEAPQSIEVGGDLSDAVRGVVDGGRGKVPHEDKHRRLLHRCEALKHQAQLLHHGRLRRADLAEHMLVSRADISTKYLHEREVATAAAVHLEGC
jgi:hypothetical protein